MTEALALYREIGDERGVANVLWGMGNIDYFSATGDQGISDFREALEIFERVGDRTMAAWSQHMLGSSLLRLGRSTRRARTCERRSGCSTRPATCPASRSSSTTSPRRPSPTETCQRAARL